MQNDLISRSALLERLKGQGIKEPNLRYADGFNAGIGAAKRMLKTAPTIDAVEVVHGRWKWEGRFKACSECGTYIDWDNTLGANHWHYCPNCGAKMDGGASDG